MATHRVFASHHKMHTRAGSGSEPDARNGPSHHAAHIGDECAGDDVQASALWFPSRPRGNGVGLQKRRPTPLTDAIQHVTYSRMRDESTKC